MSEQAMTTNEQVARALGWTDVHDLSGQLLGKPPGAESANWRTPVPDYEHSVDACGELLAWAAERGYRLETGCAPTGSSEPDQRYCADASFDNYSDTVQGATVSADTPTHALAGAICKAWLDLVAKLQEVPA